MGETGARRQVSAETELDRDWQVVAGFLREHPELIRKDEGLLGDLNLRCRTENIVDFGPAALAAGYGRYLAGRDPYCRG